MRRGPICMIDTRVVFQKASFVLDYQLFRSTLNSLLS
jgi:hypothetical protein